MVDKKALKMVVLLDAMKVAVKDVKTVA